MPVHYHSRLLARLTLPGSALRHAVDLAHAVDGEFTPLEVEEAMRDDLALILERYDHPFTGCLWEVVEEPAEPEPPAPDLVCLPARDDAAQPEPLCLAAPATEAPPPTLFLPIPVEAPAGETLPVPARADGGDAAAAAECPPDDGAEPAVPEPPPPEPTGVLEIRHHDTVAVPDIVLTILQSALRRAGSADAITLDWVGEPIGDGAPWGAAALITAQDIIWVNTRAWLAAAAAGRGLRSLTHDLGPDLPPVFATLDPFPCPPPPPPPVPEPPEDEDDLAGDDEGEDGRRGPVRPRPGRLGR